MPLCITMFQSTRPRGARLSDGLLPKRLPCFNPRAHAGRDPGGVESQDVEDGFNPRAHAGRDI